MASVGKGHKLIQRNKVKGTNQRRRGAEKGQMRGQQRWIEARARGNRNTEGGEWARVGDGVSRGNGRGQANRPRPHVSTREMREKRKNWGGSANTAGLLGIRRRKERSGSRRREVRIGRRRYTAEMVSSNSGVSKRRRNGEKRGSRTQGNEDEGEREKRGARATQRATATSRKVEEMGNDSAVA